MNSLNEATDSEPFQLLPPLSEAEYAALRADIAARGVLVPVVLDQHGRILDGHHRRAIAAELNIVCPTETRTVVDDAEAADLAVTLNCTRRHLSREQRRALIAAEIARRPDDSDRAIARRVGCSPSTVGAVRVSNLDSDLTPMEAKRARELTAQIDANLALMFDTFATLIAGRVSPAYIASRLPVTDHPAFVMLHDHVLAVLADTLEAYPPEHPWAYDCAEGRTLLAARASNLDTVEGYEKLVAEGLDVGAEAQAEIKAALATRDRLLGDLALTIAPRDLPRYADETGIDLEDLRTCREAAVGRGDA